MKALAIGILMWMQANCNAPGVHPEHNYCNLNWNHSVPEIVVLPRKQLVREFRKNRGQVPGGYNTIRGFYVHEGKERFTIYMLDQDYSQILYQADLVHELSHYIQDKNDLITIYCPPNYEIPTYLMQLHYYRKKTGGDARARMIDEYKKNTCNTLY